MRAQTSLHHFGLLIFSPLLLCLASPLSIISTIRPSSPNAPSINSLIARDIDVAAPPFIILEAGVTLEACIPDSTSPNMCTLSFHTSSLWTGDSGKQFGKLHIFDHNCIMTGENNFVGFDALARGFDFYSQLPLATVVKLDADLGVLHIDYGAGSAQLADLWTTRTEEVVEDGISKTLTIMEHPPDSWTYWSTENNTGFLKRSKHQKIGVDGMGTYELYRVPFMC